MNHFILDIKPMIKNNSPCSYTVNGDTGVQDQGHLSTFIRTHSNYVHQPRFLKERIISHPIPLYDNVATVTSITIYHQCVKAMVLCILILCRSYRLVLHFFCFQKRVLVGFVGQKDTVPRTQVLSLRPKQLWEECTQMVQPHSDFVLFTK